MNKFIFIIFLALSACKPKNTNQPDVSTNNPQTAEPAQPTSLGVTTKACKHSLRVNMSLTEIAEVSSLMRTDCGFTKVDIQLAVKKL